jgi:Zn-dependent protease
MNIAPFIFQLVILLFSVILHEVSHGLVADYLGDPTARNAGRLTMNPKAHIDPFGSIILPLLLAIPALFGVPTIIFGWAKPVPYDPRNLKNPGTGALLIALAGPGSNLAVALIFGLLTRFSYLLGMYSMLPAFLLIVHVNLILAIFNLVPIPPLDGSKLLYLFLPKNETGFRIMVALEQYGFVILLAFVFWGLPILDPIISAVFRLFVGRNLGF